MKIREILCEGEGDGSVYSNHAMILTVCDVFPMTKKTFLLR